MVVDSYHQHQQYRSTTRNTKSTNKRGTPPSTFSSSSTSASNNRRPNNHNKQKYPIEGDTPTGFALPYNLQEEHPRLPYPLVTSPLSLEGAVISRESPMMQESQNHSNRRASQGAQHHHQPERVNKQQSAPIMLPLHMDIEHEQDLHRSSRTSGSGHLDGRGRPLPSQTEEWQTQFYKTKLCPYHVEGRCINGENCRFAHTSVEVRPLPDLHRTKLCESYVRKEPCTDMSCPFAHDPSELRTSSHSFYKVTLCNFYKKGRCWNGAHCRFAHGVGELQVGPSSPTPTTASSSGQLVKQQTSSEKTNDLSKQQSVRSPQLSTSLNGRKNGADNVNGQRQQSGEFCFSNHLSRESSTSNDARRSSISESVDQHIRHPNTFEFSLLQQSQFAHLNDMQRRQYHSCQPSHPQSIITSSFPSTIPVLSQIKQLNNAQHYSPNDPHYGAYPSPVAATERSARPSSTTALLRRRSVGSPASPSSVPYRDPQYQYRQFDENRRPDIGIPHFFDAMAMSRQPELTSSTHLYNSHSIAPLPGVSTVTSSAPSQMLNLNQTQTLHDNHQAHQQSDPLMRLQTSTSTNTTTSNNSTSSSSTKFSTFRRPANGDLIQPQESSSMFNDISSPSTSTTTPNTTTTSRLIQQMSLSSTSAATSDMNSTTGLTTANPQSPFEFTPLTTHNNNSMESNSTDDTNALHALSQMDDVQSLTTALFTLLQQQSQSSATMTSPVSTASWNTSAHASPLSVPNQQTDSLTSPGDLSNPELMMNPNQWAFELLKTLENVPTNLPLDGDLNSNNSNGDRASKTSDQHQSADVRLPHLGHFGTSSSKSSTPSFHQQFMAFVASVAASPTSRSPRARDDPHTNLFNIHHLQGNQMQQQNGNGVFSGTTWPPSLEVLNSKPDSLTVLPSLSNLVLSSFMNRGTEQRGRIDSSGDETHHKHESAEENNDREPSSCSGETPTGQQSLYTLSLDKLVGFVNDVSNDDDRVLSNVSTGATTTAVHSPRRPADGNDSGATPRSSILSEESNSNNGNEMPSLASQQLLHALHGIVPSSTKPFNITSYTTAFPSPFAPFINNFTSNDMPGSHSSKLSELFTPPNPLSTEMSGPSNTLSDNQSMVQRRENHRLSFPSPRTTDRVNHQNSSEFSENLIKPTGRMDTPTAIRHASVPSPFPPPSNNLVGDSTPENIQNDAPEHQWTPVPLGVTRRSSFPHLATKLEESNENEIRQLSTAQEAAH